VSAADGGDRHALYYSRIWKLGPGPGPAIPVDPSGTHYRNINIVLKISSFGL